MPEKEPARLPLDPDIRDAMVEMLHNIGNCYQVALLAQMEMAKRLQPAQPEIAIVLDHLRIAGLATGELLKATLPKSPIIMP